MTGGRALNSPAPHIRKEAVVKKILFLIIGLTVPGAVMANNAAVALSSSTVTTVGNVQASRILNVSNLGNAATIYYKVDGSTINIPTTGFAIAPNAEKHQIHRYEPVKFQLPEGQAATTIRVYETVR